MKDKERKNGVKKAIYKKWWFWVIIVVILSAVFGNTETKDSVENVSKDVNSSVEQQIIDKFVEEVKIAIDGAVNSKEEFIEDVVLKDGDLCITVDLSKANPTPLTLEDLAISRTSSITDAILDITDYDNHWNTITIDFGVIGRITNSKEDIKENIAGRYFPAENFILK